MRETSCGNLARYRSSLMRACAASGAQGRCALGTILQEVDGVWPANGGWRRFMRAVGGASEGSRLGRCVKRSASGYVARPSRAVRVSSDRTNSDTHRKCTGDTLSTRRLSCDPSSGPALVPARPVPEAQRSRLAARSTLGFSMPLRRVRAGHARRRNQSLTGSRGRRACRNRCNRRSLPRTLSNSAMVEAPRELLHGRFW